MEQQNKGWIHKIVPTLCVGTPLATLCVADAERPGRHSHAERGSDRWTSRWSSSWHYPLPQPC
ncbi:hypothetical protein FIV37_06350 [Pseudomonas gessardii]|nr:hypothetical protein [Pseudomonas gessardii]